MHELPVVEEILRIVLKHAFRHRAERVLAVHLEVGALSELEDQWLQRYFSFCSRKTPASEARLLIKRLPAAGVCLECGAASDSLENAGDSCLNCQSGKMVPRPGPAYRVVNLEVI